LQALLAVLQEDVPLQVLMPEQWTPADLALEGAMETPLIARAIAATAMLLPDTIFIFISHSLGLRPRARTLHETNSWTVIRPWSVRWPGRFCYS
jgi:hypothetical protein